MNIQDILYFDYAAATPMDDRVKREMEPYFSDLFFNPSSPYASAVAVRREYEHAKHRLAQCIGAKKDDCIITAGATESIALAMTAAGDGHVVTSSIEHAAVLNAVDESKRVDVMPTPKGDILPQSIISAITDETQLVTIGLANSELGTVQPLREISAAVQDIRRARIQTGNTRPLWLHTDASQGVGLLDTTVSRLGVDMITLNAGKVYGPKQVGLLWRSAGVMLRPLFVGGGQEMALRGGTQNVAGVVGFAKALELATDHRKAEVKRLTGLRTMMIQGLQKIAPDMIVSGNQKRTLPGHIHVSFPGIDAERLIFLLENDHMYVSTGSACSANHGAHSHVLTAIGMDQEAIAGSLRITMGRFTTQDMVERAIDCVARAVAKEKERMTR